MVKYVVGFLFNKERTEVALIIKKKPKWQEGKANGIGGKIEPTDESVYHAISREFYEETGVYIAEQEWDHYATWKGADYICNFLRASDDNIQNVVTTEEEEVIVINIDALDIYDHIPNLRWLIPMALDTDVKHVVITDNGN